jgi:hypothetical protein
VLQIDPITLLMVPYLLMGILFTSAVDTVGDVSTARRVGITLFVLFLWPLVFLIWWLFIYRKQP